MESQLGFVGEERMAKRPILEQELALEIGQSYEIIANYKCLVCEPMFKKAVLGGRLGAT